MNYIKISEGYCYLNEKGFHFTNKKLRENSKEYKKISILQNENNKEYKETKKISKIVFYTTRNCNLNCIYCYADAGKIDEEISLEHAYIVIDYISEKVDEFIVDFHGGGEPLEAFEKIKKIHEYAKNTGKLKDTVLITNGYIEENDKLEWIKENVDRLAVSMDGFAEIQNKNRPSKELNNSYDKVINTIKFLIKNKKKFVVRATITKDTTKEMESIVKHFHLLGVKDIILSPCYNFGRDNDFALLPEPTLYSENFIRAFEYAFNNGIKLRTSSFRVPGNDYCGAIPGFNIGITTDGYISTCYEVISNEDKSANEFIVGKINIENRKIDFDIEKLKKLKAIEKIDIECDRCKYKLICRGRCPVKIIRNNKESAKNICMISKMLIPRILDYIYKNPDSAKNLLNNIEIDF